MVRLVRKDGIRKGDVWCGFLLFIKWVFVVIVGKFFILVLMIVFVWVWLVLVLGVYLVWVSVLLVVVRVKWMNWLLWCCFCGFIMVLMLNLNGFFFLGGILLVIW